MSAHEDEAAPHHSPGISVEWQPDAAGVDRPIPIPIVTFDPTTLDTIEEELLEHLDNGQPIGPVIRRLRREIERDEGSRIRKETTVALLGEIMRARNWQMAAYAVAFSANMELTLGLSGTQIATQFGVRKQDFYQLVKEYRGRLGLNIQLPNARSPEARKNMAERNHRHGGR